MDNAVCPLHLLQLSYFLLQSPPSCYSKPLLIPELKEDHQWRLGGLLQRVNGKEISSPSAAGEGGVTQVQVGGDKERRCFDRNGVARGQETASC